MKNKKKLVNAETLEGVVDAAMITDEELLNVAGGLVNDSEKTISEVADGITACRS